MYDELFQRLLAAGKIIRDGVPTDDSSTSNVQLVRPLSDNVCAGRNSVAVKVFHSQMGKLGTWENLGVSYNARTDVGAAWTAGLLGGAGTAAPAVYIGITTDATATAKGDTTLASEETANGLGRALGTYALTVDPPATLNGQDTYTISNTFTYTGSTLKALAKGGLFTASSSGIMVFETVFTALGYVNASGDKLQVIWSVQC